MNRIAHYLFRFTTSIAFLMAPLAFGSEAMQIGSGDICKIDELNKATGNTLCLCEVQARTEWNKREYPFYKVGCGKWLNSQKCNVRKTIDQGENVESLLATIKDLSVIKVGYVGHWASANQTIGYINERLVPMAKSSKAKIFYDNTACSGASDPIAVRNHLQDLPIDLKGKISVKANQIISVGEWDNILSPILKANAEITMCERGLEVPSCRSFKDRGCSIHLNHQDQIGCIDRQGSFKVLKCERKERKRGQNIGRLELGKWSEIDISNYGGEIVKINIAEALPSQLVKVKAEFDVSGEDLLNYGYENAYEKGEIVSFEEIKDIFVPYSMIQDPQSDESQEHLKILVGASYLVDAEFADRVSIIENLSMSLPVDVSEVFAYIPNNPNLKVRISTDLDRLKYFQETANPIVNFYLMHRDGIEAKLRKDVEDHLRRRIR